MRKSGSRATPAASKPRYENNVLKFPGKRWPASGNDPELSVVEVLEGLAADIRKGIYSPDAMILGFVHPQSDGTVQYPYVSVNLSPLELSGLLAKLTKELS